MKTAVYPGTFDPITHGHSDIIRRGFRMFEKVIVAIAPNPGKHPFFSVKERLEMVGLVTKDLPNLEVRMGAAKPPTMPKIASQIESCMTASRQVKKVRKNSRAKARPPGMRP